MKNKEKSKAKLSSKGMSQQQNKYTWERYMEALNGAADKATNQGFQMAKGTICTYTQNKLGRIAYYDKQWVLLDGIHMEPMSITYWRKSIVGGMASSSSRTNPRFGPSCR